MAPQAEPVVPPGVVNVVTRSALRGTEVIANGVRGKGVVGPRDVFGKQSNMAFLAFSETWLHA